MLGLKAHFELYPNVIIRAFGSRRGSGRKSRIHIFRLDSVHVVNASPPSPCIATMLKEWIRSTDFRRSKQDVVLLNICIFGLVRGMQHKEAVLFLRAFCGTRHITVSIGQIVSALATAN
jgi:hypothetical protein